MLIITCNKTYDRHSTEAGISMYDVDTWEFANLTALNHWIVWVEPMFNDHDERTKSFVNSFILVIVRFTINY